MEEIPKRTKRDESTEVVVEYVGRRLAKMVFEKPNKLHVYATENDYVDLEMFDALPDDIPNRALVRKALSMLPNNFNPSTELKGVIFPQDEESVFVDPKTFTIVLDGRRIRWDEFVKQKIPFVKHVVPFLSYKDVQMLESVKELRLLISDNENGVWKSLFERDFPELYSETIFPKKITKEITETNGMCIFLNSISQDKTRIGTKEPTIRPYWKLLYEYHLKQTTAKYGKTFSMSAPSFNKVRSCAFYRDQTICLGMKDNVTGLWDGHHNGNWKFLQQKGPAVFAKVVATKVFGQQSALPGAEILAFEKRANHVFVCIANSDNNEKFRILMGRGLDAEKLDPSWDLGLIGETGYFATRKPKQESFRPYKNFETLIHDPENNIHVVLDYYKRVYVCYNTVSQCFLEADLRDGNGNYDADDLYRISWKKLTTSGIETISNFEEEFEDATYFNRTLFTLNSRYFVEKDLRDGTDFLIVIRRFDGEITEIDRFPYNITDMCIVGKSLYLFSSGHGIYIVDMEKALAKEKHKLYRSPDIFVWCPFNGEVFFDYVRMTPRGPALCSTNPARAPILFRPNAPDFQLFACQVCQKPSQLKCSMCKTPTCSEECFQCCK